MKLSDYLQALTFDIPFDLEHFVISGASLPLKVAHHTFPVPLSLWDIIKVETGVRDVCTPCTRAWLSHHVHAVSDREQWRQALDERGFIYCGKK